MLRIIIMLLLLLFSVSYSWYTRLCRPVFLADVVDSQLVTAGILDCVVLSL